MNQKELWAETEKVWAAADRMWAKADAAFRAMPKPQQPADETTTFRLRGNRLRLFWRLFRAACIALATGKATLTLRSKPNDKDVQPRERL